MSNRDHGDVLACAATKGHIRVGSPAAARVSYHQRPGGCIELSLPLSRASRDSWPCTVQELQVRYHKYTNVEEVALLTAGDRSKGRWLKASLLSLLHLLGGVAVGLCFASGRLRYS